MFHRKFSAYKQPKMAIPNPKSQSDRGEFEKDYAKQNASYHRFT